MPQNFGVTGLPQTVNSGISGITIQFQNPGSTSQKATITIPAFTNIPSGVVVSSPEVHVFFPGNNGTAESLNSGPLTVPQGGSASWSFNRQSATDTGTYNIQIVYYVTVVAGQMPITWGVESSTPPVPSNTNINQVALSMPTIFYSGSTTGITITVVLSGGGE